MSVAHHSAGGQLSSAQFTWLVDSLCQLNRIPFDPAPHGATQLVEACASYGLRTRTDKAEAELDELRNPVAHA